MITKYLFYLLGYYPEEIPEMKVLNCIGESTEILNTLEKCANENRGDPMLYILLEKVLYIMSHVEVKESMSPEKSQCKFYLEGKCKFGEKCFNLHGTSSEDNMAKSSDRNIDWHTSVNDSNDLGKLKSRNSSCRTSDNAVCSKKYPKTSKVDSKIGGKKSPMKTAIDVINRIMWDESFPTENFIVGYLDRFLGVQEKPFTAFSWEDIASVDYNVLAIPKHRIQYFKYKNVIIWDKNERLDKVFGSTGDVISVMDIINDESIENININQGNDDDDDDLHNLPYLTKNRPNYFMCLRINDDEVKQNIVKVSQLFICEI